jgi:hypothetical protein
MKLKHIANIKTGQDGAVFKDLIFRLDARGNCSVYNLSESIFESDAPTDILPIGEFLLDRAEQIVPHSNSVVFGSEYYAEGDEFPLLYTNIYNNYAKEENKRCGVCCVYRIEREKGSFKSTLVQLIEIGFTDSRELWRSSGEVNDVRPYGNFVVDVEKAKYWAYVMRDGERSTRYFRFSLPSVADGELDADIGVKKVVLFEKDIEEYFDTPYHNYVQGAVCHGDKIYEVEGFGKDVRSAIRIIDLKEKRQEIYFDFYAAGYEDEPEFIDFYGERCVYSDAHGRVFLLTV